MTFNLSDFNQFFEEYRQRFVHFVVTYVHDEAVAEDIVIESMMYYWENKGRLAADTNIAAYVLTAIKHKCIDYLRHRRLQQEVSDEISRLHAWELSSRILSLEDFEPDEIFTHEIQEIVDKALSALPEQTRRIFVMSRYENKSHKEIAESLGISTKGVEFHISKATKVLRLALKDYLPAALLFLHLH
ncbi:RNA polymerase sigma-70 factor (ECF subfamily) [Bacteroides zoogleoformans]|uniref:RNA polymerase sigma-70 factor n=1 Tax=Bacteroides zoogleoformans TaxID=28119 RepID=A0ABM6T6N5_9BACE|nr:RNA polymerase sigma-70 factor [Bacteroides zoogleoformans]AVM52243.1 RNA polymerase sigma-70 factor [Bacteroides zoogleoformans]TWJ11102.1 RNA polymerase sigma-70 factor (ECF subfamily) [Bacteroides zoogleoformans]